jgi:hypothetical protein
MQAELRSDASWQASVTFGSSAVCWAQEFAPAGFAPFPCNSPRPWELQPLDVQRMLVTSPLTQVRSGDARLKMLVTFRHTRATVGCSAAGFEQPEVAPVRRAGTGCIPQPNRHTAGHVRVIAHARELLCLTFTADAVWLAAT